MNKLWIWMVVCALVFGLVTHKTIEMNQILVSIGKETLDYVFPLVATISFWCGILEVAKDNGLLTQLQKAMAPLLNRLFPDLKEEPEAKSLIAANIVINMFGLGSAATPSGLEAMKEMQKKNAQPHIATRSMVTFLVLNTAGVTILNTTILSLRTQFQAVNPTDFMLFAFGATLFSCIVGLFFDRWWNYGRK